MAKIEWEKNKQKQLTRNRGVLCVKDEKELREGDAAARWLEKNDTPGKSDREPRGLKVTGADFAKLFNRTPEQLEHAAKVAMETFPLLPGEGNGRFR